MIILKKHAELIKRMLDKWDEGLELERVLDKLTDEDIEYLFHLDLEGLLTEEEGVYTLTQAGHMVGEVIREAEEKLGPVEEWDEDFRFVGSEVISMLEIALLAQGDISLQEEISSALERRGLAEEGKLLPIGESLLQAYQIAESRVFITPTLAEKLRKTPPGPGKKSFLPLSKEEVMQLEAMGLLTFSLPHGNNYSLTGAGQQIRAGLIKGAAVNFPLTSQILIALLEGEQEEEMKEKLMLMGALDSRGELLPAGQHLLRAAHLLYVEPILINPSIDIDTQDLTILEMVDELWKVHETNPEIYPSYWRIREKAEEEHSITPWKVSYSLYLLESYRMLHSYLGEKGDLVYELTDWGQKVLQDRKGHGKKEVRATAVMAITTTRMENLSPGDSWVANAEEEGLLGNGFPSKSGRFFAQLASSIERLPMLSAFEARVLKTMPLWRGVFEPWILSKFPPKEEEHVRGGLRKLVGQSLVDALPGGFYRITEAGERLKRAVAAVPDGIEFHLTPHLARFLMAAKEATDEKGRVNLKEAEKISGLDPEVFGKTLTQAKVSHFFKEDKITTAGELVLEAIEILSQAITLWEEIEI